MQELERLGVKGVSMGGRPAAPGAEAGTPRRGGGSARGNLRQLPWRHHRACRAQPDAGARPKMKAHRRCPPVDADEIRNGLLGMDAIQRRAGCAGRFSRRANPAARGDWPAQPALPNFSTVWRWEGCATLQTSQESDERLIHLCRLLLLRPVTGVLYQHGVAQVRYPQRHAFRHLRP